MTKLQYLLNSLFYIICWYLVLAITIDQYDVTQWKFLYQIILQMVIFYQIIRIADLENKQ